MVKNYGVFKLTYNSVKKDAKERHLRWIREHFMHKSWDGTPVWPTWMIRSLIDATTNKEVALALCGNFRHGEAYYARSERGYSPYKTKYFVHECDELGNYVPSSRELREAALMEMKAV